MSVTTGDAPELRSWSGSQACCGEDAHPVHGVLATDGSVVMVGKADAGGGQTTGFVTRWAPPDGPAEGRLVDGVGSVIQATLVLDPDSSLLQVAEAEDVVVAVGFEASSASTGARGVALALDPVTLAIRARLQVEAPVAGRSAALESVAVHEDGTVVVGGSWNLRREEMEGFKSYGNLVGGSGVLIQVDPAAWLDAGSAGAGTPEDSDAVVLEVPEIWSLKSLRVGSDGSVAGIGSDRDEVSGMVWLEPGLDGFRWTTYPEVELTDLAILKRPGEPDAVALVGHGGAGTIDGSVRLVDAQGETSWELAFGNPGVDATEAPAGGLAPDTFVFDECWGAAQLGEGLVLACGTGIEGCDAVVATAADRRTCRRDPRRSWRSYLVGVHGDGRLAWSRADSFVEKDGEASESAAEFVLVDGGEIYAVVDQVFGVGLARFGW